jgi:hypothetical protein
MNSRETAEALNDSIDTLLARGEFASAGDEEVDALARLAGGLRGLAAPGFKERLRSQLLSDAPAQPAVAAWFGAQAAFLAGGASSGVVGGACCISGFTAHVLGLASASAVESYIHATIPYFVALSIVSIIAWVAWLLRGQGLTVLNLLLTVKRHGLALGGAYAAVFASSMALTMAAGLY